MTCQRQHFDVGASGRGRLNALIAVRSPYEGRRAVPR
jgi:hypothetical protein